MSDFIAIAAIIMQRPMFLGYWNASLGLILLIVSLTISILATRPPYRISRDAAKIAAISIIVSTANSAINSGAGIAISIKVIIINILVICAIFLRPNVNIDRMHRTTRWVFRIIIFSGLTTMAISRYSFSNLPDLTLFNIPIKDRGATEYFSVYFPLSTIPYPMTTERLVLMRNTFLTIEPGVAVFIVLLWRHLEGVKSGIRRIFLDLIFALSLAATASTTSPIMFAIWFFFRKVSEDKKVLTSRNFVRVILGLMCGYLLIFYTPFFGINEKSLTHGSSFEDRIDWYTGETGIRRAASLSLVILYYILVRNYLSNSYFYIFVASFVVCALNVLSFTPLFFLAAYTCLRTPNATAKNATVLKKEPLIGARHRNNNH